MFGFNVNSTINSIIIHYLLIIVLVRISITSFSLLVQGQTIENSTASNLIISKYYTFFNSSSRIILTASNSDITQRLIYSKKEIFLDFRLEFIKFLFLFSLILIFVFIQNKIFKWINISRNINNF